MDPNTATCEEFTNHLLHKEIPTDATDDWVEQAKNLKQLLSQLAFHEAMESNLTQTYMTQAASKYKMYCKCVYGCCQTRF